MADVRLPADLQSGIEQLTTNKSLVGLSKRVARISEGYRRFESSKLAVREEDDVTAYAVSRLPATYAAVATVFASLSSAYPEFRPTDILDIGAGPGTASWAASQTWESIETARLVDHSASFLDVARRLAATANSRALQSAQFERADITTYVPDTRFSLVVASYAMTEVSDPASLARRLFESTSGALALIEPGRSRDYSRLLEVRRAILSLGGRMLVPCPHAHECPLPAGDWCHFSARLPRTRQHRHAKNASVPYEDEKFSYMVFGAPSSDFDTHRFSIVLAPPSTTKHNVTLKLCTSDGLAYREVRGRDPGDFKWARKLDWGEILDEPAGNER